MGLEGLVVEGGDEVGVHKLEEVVDEVVGEEGLVGGYFGVVAKCGQSVEVEIGWEIALERVEDEIASALQNLLVRVVGFIKNVLKLFQHI